MTRTILHADMDAFYAAVEAREDPSIADRPIVVGADPRDGQGRGVVAACNYGARHYGIHSAMPISEAYRRCPNAVYLRPRMALYAQVSERVMHIFEGYTELLEKLSIDEAFLDVTASIRLFGDGPAIARQIKREVQEREGLTVSIGVAPNKFLAKLASDLEKPDGLVVVEPGREAEFLQPLPVERLWGVGPRTAQRLHILGIRTIRDLAATPLRRLERRLGGAHAAHLHRLAHGVDDRPVMPHRARKQISRETTFDSDIDDRAQVEKVLLALTEEVTARLRARELTGRTVVLKLRLAPFDTLTRRHTAEAPLSTTDAVFPIVRQLFQDADPGDRPIRLVGVGVAGLAATRDGEQLALFDQESPDAGAQRLADAMDRVSERFGRDALKRGRLIGDAQDSDDE